VTEYNKEYLLTLSDDELIQLLDEAESKESFFNTEQMALKILINSLYGAFANKWFPLLNESLAQAITGNGRFFIQMLANNIEKKLQSLNPSDKPYIVYGDTDSVYFQIEPFMDMFVSKNPNVTLDEQVDWADEFDTKVIKPVIQDTIDRFAYLLNAKNKDAIGAEREIIADAAVFAEQKKYYARVRDSEGTRYPPDDPYIKIMGLEAIKSSTPVWSKIKLKEAIPHILDKDEQELRDWLKQIKSEFLDVDPGDISIVGGVSSLDYVLGGKAIPIGSRAALVHNHFVIEQGLDDSIAPIQPGDKCKRLYLTTPNMLNSNIVAFTNDRFVNHIRDIIDYDTMFEKGFVKPLELMVKCLKYDLDKETEKLDEW